METPNSFEKLCNQIRTKATGDIKQNRPQNQLLKWQILLIAILETELAIHRVRIALKSLNTTLPRELLQLFSMSRGTWIDYHFGNWSFWICSLLDKEIYLVSQIGQRLIKPNNPNHKSITRPLIESLIQHKDKIGKIRHPLAHGVKGGTIESIMNTDTLKDYVNISSPVDWNDILASYEPYQKKWYGYLHKYSVRVLAELFQISEQLKQSINWDKI